jgi:hypothetical protein
MNQISDYKLGEAVAMFCGGRSIRQVAKACGIARETANRIRDAVKASYTEAGETFFEITGGRPRGGKPIKRMVPPAQVNVRKYLALRMGINEKSI